MAPLTYGMVEGSVRGVLARVLQQSGDGGRAIIRCLDSLRSPVELGGVVLSRGVKGRVLPSGVELDVAALRGLLDAEAFSGFDEVWLYPPGRSPTDRTLAASITSDAVQLDAQAPPPELVDAFLESGCRLALGDGCGLNYMEAGSTLRALLSPPTTV